MMIVYVYSLLIFLESQISIVDFVVSRMKIALLLLVKEIM